MTQKNKFETEVELLNSQSRLVLVIGVSNFEFVWNLVLVIWNFTLK